MDELAVEVEHLSFSYKENGPKVLDDISFSIKKGDYVALIGHNGSGKSTLARILAGLYTEIEPNSLLRIFNMSYDAENSSKIRSLIGIVFQNPDNQFVGSSVRDDIAFGLENRAIDPSKMDEIIERSAKEVGMEEYLDQAPENLSGGQKQRVALAGVLALSPSLLLLDEATSMLDPKGKREILSLVKERKKENPNLTILSITHDVEEAAMADYVLVLSKGKIILEGKGEEVFSHEKELEEANLDAPFAYELGKALKARGISLSSSLEEDTLLEELCQYSSKK